MLERRSARRETNGGADPYNFRLKFSIVNLYIYIGKGSPKKTELQQRCNIKNERKFEINVKSY